MGLCEHTGQFGRDLIDCLSTALKERGSAGGQLCIALPHYEDLEDSELVGIVSGLENFAVVARGGLEQLNETMPNLITGSSGRESCCRSTDFKQTPWISHCEIRIDCPTIYNTSDCAALFG